MADVNENDFTELLKKAEEYEDLLDKLHPEDEVAPVFSPEPAHGFRSRKMAIVVGHSQRSPGAKGASPILTHEYFWNKKLAGLIKTHCDERNIQCGIFFRDGLSIIGAYKKVAN